MREIQAQLRLDFPHRVNLSGSCFIIASRSITHPRRSSMKLRVGDQAPDFVLNSHLDREVRLSSLQGKAVVLAFFPLAWTPI
jgi:hypothetical protein